jgi:hypothetical protein
MNLLQGQLRVVVDLGSDGHNKRRVSLPPQLHYWIIDLIFRERYSRNPLVD